MYRNGKKRFAALYLALCLMLIGMPVIQAKAAPDAPTVSAGLESIAVSGFTSGAILKLYLTNGTLISNAGTVTGATYTFTGVVPNVIQYYVTQTVDSVESTNSIFVNSTLPTPTLSAGIGYVDAGNIFPGAAIMLYTFEGSLVSSSPSSNGDGTWRFGGLSAGSQYYVIQSINGVTSLGSGAVTVLAPVPPSAPSVSAGEESITVSGFTSGATLKLYLTDGSPVSNAGSIAGSTYTFMGVVPNSLSYYVTQTVGGVESANSSFVNSTLPTPTLSAGIGYVDAGNIFPGATIKLYTFEGSLVSSSPSSNGDGTSRFSGLSAGSQYYIIQSINGVTSLESGVVTVHRPDPPVVWAWEESIAVNVTWQNATYKVYTFNGDLVTHVGLGSVIAPVCYIFGIEPNSEGYYVTQILNGSESLNSEWVNSILMTPTASAGTGYVDVGNIHPGATITLYNAGGSEVSVSPAVYDESFHFTGVAEGDGYYVVQSINNVISPSSNAVTVTALSHPGAPMAEAGLESITVTGFTQGATLKLYLTNGSFATSAGAVTGTSYIFAFVTPNTIQYYVTQSVDSLESVNSNFVNPTLRKPALLSGVGFVDVSNIYPGASIALYDVHGTLVSDTSAENGDGSFRFLGIAPGQGYYAVQAIHGVVSAASNSVTVQPSAPSASAGVESLTAGGYLTGATLKLYRWNGSLVDTAANVASASHLFPNVVPDSAGYYITQTFGGVESANSAWVNSLLRAPSIAAGIGYIDVGNLYPGAAVNLYDAGGASVSVTPAANADGTVRFDGLPAGGWYYAVQSINGVVSPASELAGVRSPHSPDAPATANGIESILVSSFVSGATLRLYRWNGTLVATAANVTADAYTFTDIVPWHDGYYVTQTVNGQESVNSPWTVANVRTPVAMAGAGMVNVQNLYPGANLKLYDANHVLISDKPSDNGDGTQRFSGLASGKMYYAKQTINQIASEASNTVSLPAVPNAPLNVKAYAGDGYATVKFDTPLSDGGSSILHYVVTVSPGGKTVISEKTSVKINGLTNGKQYTFTVKAINAAGESAESAPSNTIKPYNQADTGTSSERSDNKGQNVVVIVNGVVQDAGTSEIIEQNGRTVLAVTVDNTKLQKILHKTGDHATVLIPIDVMADTVSVIFSGQMLEDMSTGEAVLDIQTPDAIYSVSARNLDLSSLLKQFGQGIDLNEVEMSFIIEEQGDAVVFGPDSVTVKMARFTLVCTYGDETVEVTDVSSFMARKIPIPDGTNPASIKNAIVERQEGVYITEQAEILTENGKTYVVIQ